MLRAGLELGSSSSRLRVLVLLPCARRLESLFYFASVMSVLNLELAESLARWIVLGSNGVLKKGKEKSQFNLNILAR